MKHIILSLLAFMAMPLQLCADDTEIWVSFPSNPNRDTNGIYAFPASDPSAIAAKKTAPELYFPQGVGYQDGVIYGLDYQQGFFTPDRHILYAIDTSDWSVTSRDVSVSFQTKETANGIDGTVYALFKDGAIGTVDYKNLVRSDIYTPSRSYVALGVTSTGELYGIDDDGYLVRISTANGAETVVGQTGLSMSSYSHPTGEIDPVTNTFYLLAEPTYSDPYTLYAIDLSTCAVSTLGSVDASYDYLNGMIILGEPAAAGAPGKATGLTAQFEGSSLSGTFSFTAPTETFDHQELTGEMTYTLTYGTDDGTKQTLSGKVEAGGTVTKQLTLAEGGNVTFAVRLSNASGEGQTASLTQWIGPDAPLPPTMVSLAMDAEGNVTLSWQPSAGTLNGGYMGTITYNVYRSIDGEETLAAEGISATSFSEKLEVTTMREYAYIVVANNEGTLSERALSNRIVAGDGFGVPFVENFGEGNRLEYFTVINVNGDSDRWGELTWKMHTQMSYWGAGESYEEMWCETSGQTDDWLITPPIQLLPGNAYALTFKMKAGYSDTPEKFEVMMGTAATVDGMTTTLLPERTISNTDYQTFTKELTVDKAGSYCFGFHATPNLGSALYLDDVEVRISASQDAPARAENLKVEADATGLLSATVSFNAPTKTIAGDELTAIERIEVLRETTIIATIDHPAVGSTQEVNDLQPVNGFNNYTVIAYNAEGNGLRAEANDVYVGVDTPLPPVMTTIADLGGSVHFEWAEAARTGIRGYVVRPDEVVYHVYETQADGSRGALIYEGKDRSVDADYEETEEFDIAKWLVVAENVAGTSSAGAAKIATGIPMLLPYRETFAMGALKTSVWTEQSGVRSFNPTTDDSAADDAGAILFVPYQTGDNSSYNTPRLTFAGAKQPTLAFYHKAEAGSNSSVAAKVWTKDGTETVLTSFDYQTASAADWTKETIDLTAFKQQDFVVVKFFATGEAGKPIFIDDVTIRDAAFEDEPVIPTAILSAECGKVLPCQNLHDLQGRSIRNPQPGKGVYIINGKKVIIK